MMAKQTGGILNLTKPEIADNIKQTIGEILPDNFQAISDIVSEHLANEDMHVLEEEKTGWDARETTEGAQAKADAAELSAKSYADNKANDLAGTGRTTETVKGNADRIVMLEQQIETLRTEILALKGSGF